AGLEDRVTQIGRHDRRAQLDGRGRPPGECDRRQGVAEHLAGIPQRAEAVGLGALGLTDDSFGVAGGAGEPDLHTVTVAFRRYSRRASSTSGATSRGSSTPAATARSAASVNWTAYVSSSPYMASS